MDRLPEFSFADYNTLLESFQRAGYRFGLIADKDTYCQTVYLRHDVDFFLSDWLTIPEIEAASGARATYYILVGHYDLDSNDAKSTLRSIVNLGHEIGLHYDTRRYPAEGDAARSRMQEEIDRLVQITGRPIRTIARHNVFMKAHEPSRIDGLVDPFDPAYLEGMTYISDSVRSWRDEKILDCFGPHRPEQVVLLTHPESWLDGSIKNRVDYLRRIVFPRLKEDDALKEELLRIWTTHEAARLHDRRESELIA